jgi:hypothetical protein
MLCGFDAAGLLNSMLGGYSDLLRCISNGCLLIAKRSTAAWSHAMVGEVCCAHAQANQVRLAFGWLEGGLGRAW